MSRKTPDNHLIWENMDSETVYDARIFRVRTVRRRRASGEHAPFISVDAPDWVTVIPEMPGSNGPEFLVVKQYRHGTERVGVEFPAGVIDPGESPETAAGRELLEETGYKASELIRIGAVSPNPAFMTNITFTYLAKGLEKVAEQSLDEHEILDVHIEEFESLQRQMGTDPFDSAITIQAWHLYLMASGRI
ncbi:MAG: NUDIX hydrolase [Spirochaetaceae bacterium]|nr:NUDIX hydrolase [Spirochaetaceae bacterium]MDT8298508.1 NUDIX hydrolase [Spirochaetaceae bacterium]